MEYPNSKFTKPLRLLLLSSFILAFFIIAPLIIFYAIGYRYDWQYGVPRKTGALSVDIKPKTGDVYLDDTILPKNTFNKKVEVKNLIPGKYSLTIKTPNYYQWQKDIEIKAKETVYIKEINLIQKNQAQSLINKKIEFFSLSPNFQFLIYSIRDNQQTQIWLYNNNNQKTNFLYKLNSDKALEVNWANEYNCATINEQDSYRNLTIICIDKTPELTKLPNNKEVIKKIQWNTTKQAKLYYSTDKNIFSFIPKTKQNRLVTNNNFIDWYMDNEQLWSVQINTNTKYYQIIKDTLGFKTKFNQIKIIGDLNKALNKKYNLVIAKNNNVLLKEQSSPNMILLNSDKSYNIAGEKFLLSPHNQWWLIWTPWELWTYIEGEKPELQNRSGKNLQQVIPLDKFNSLGMVWQDKITVLFPYYLVTHDLLNNQVKQAAADSKNRILYFIQKNKQGIWKLNY